MEYDGRNAPDEPNQGKTVFRFQLSLFLAVLPLMPFRLHSLPVSLDFLRDLESTRKRKNSFVKEFVLPNGSTRFEGFFRLVLIAMLSEYHLLLFNKGMSKESSPQKQN